MEFRLRSSWLILTRSALRSFIGCERQILIGRMQLLRREFFCSVPLPLLLGKNRAFGGKAQTAWKTVRFPSISILAPYFAASERRHSCSSGSGSHVMLRAKPSCCLSSCMETACALVNVSHCIMISFRSSTVAFLSTATPHSASMFRTGRNISFSTKEGRYSRYILTMHTS